MAYNVHHLLVSHFAAEVAARASLLEIEKYRAGLLIRQLKERGAWFGDPKAEMVEYRRLLKEVSNPAAAAYMKQLRDERTPPVTP